MQPGEYEQLLHDAEVRLARLKALYEQYFQGIEKLEPTVPRKELDRVMEILRKTQPRNTALRFRMQMLLAKYGTYQTYWQRIARQIEEGTFRRDVVRAQQRRMRERAQVRREENEGPSAWELDVDVELDAPESAKDALAFDETDVDAILGSLGGRASSPAPAPTSRRPLSPFAAKNSAPPGATQTSSPPSQVTPSPGAAPPAGKPITTFGKPVTTFGRPAATKPQQPIGAPPAQPAAAQPAIAPATAPRSAPQPAAPATVQATAPQPASFASIPRPAPAVPATPGARPAPPAPPSGVRPPPAPPAPRPPTPSAPDDARLRKIYETYVEARRRNNERVDNVKFETVAQSVQQMIPKLREKHGNRPIDFEVVVQNGKVGLKPKVGG